MTAIQNEDGRRRRRAAFWLVCAPAIAALTIGTSVWGFTGNRSHPEVLAQQFLGGGSGHAIGSPSPSPTTAPGSELPTVEVLAVTVGKAGNGNGNGGGNNPSHQFTLSSTTSGLLAPGQPQVLHVKVSNPNNQDIQVTRLSVTFGTPSNPECSSSWFAMTPYVYSASNPKLIVPKNSSRVVDLAIQLIESGTNQDACKGATIPLGLSGTAQQVVP